MKKYLSYLVTKIKGESFLFDDNIPMGYILWRVIFKRLVMICRGLIVFGSISPRIFIDKKSKIISKRKFIFKGTVSIGRCCYIDALSKEGIQFGKNVSVGANTTIECSGTLKNIGKGLKVGNNVGFGTNGFFGCAGGVEIGDDTIFGNYVSLHSENHNFQSLAIPIRLQGVNRKGIKIGANCWVGSKVTILDGASIEDGCIIAAGALVISGKYMSNGIYGGIPAKLIKYRSDE